MCDRDLSADEAHPETDFPSTQALAPLAPELAQQNTRCGVQQKIHPMLHPEHPRHDLRAVRDMRESHPGTSQRRVNRCHYGRQLPDRPPHRLARSEPRAIDGRASESSDNAHSPPPPPRPRGSPDLRDDAILQAPSPLRPSLIPALNGLQMTHLMRLPWMRAGIREVLWRAEVVTAHAVEERGICLILIAMQVVPLLHWRSCLCRCGLEGRTSTDVRL